MLEWIRLKFGRVMISIIIGFIAFVFVFYGIFSPRATRGLHQGAVAGMVNGEAITLPEFSRALSQRMEFFKNLAGGKITEEQLKAFRIREGVFGELVNRKLMSQEALRMGIKAGDEEIREKIKDLSVFQKDGKFDLNLYRGLLEANHYTTASFESMMREDVTLQNLNDYLRARVHYSEVELKQEFVELHDKRDLKYVLLTLESGRKALKVSPEEVKKFLSEPSQVNLAKTQFEAKKDREYKGMEFEKVKEKIAEEVLASKKTDEIRKLNEQLAEQVLALLKPDPASIAAKKPEKKTVNKPESKPGNKPQSKEDEKINALLKLYGVEVKKTGFMTRSARFIPGVGEASLVMADAYDPKLPIDPSAGGRAKKYNLPSGILVVLVNQSEKPDLSAFDSEKTTLADKLTQHKWQELHQALVKKLNASAKIDKNPQVVDSKEDMTAGVPYEDG